VCVIGGEVSLNVGLDESLGITQGCNRMCARKHGKLVVRKQILL
jgi:hypothetical protein